MKAIAIKSIDQANFWLVIGACIFAHVMPIEALVLSYAFLGPAHYLTQISWMHDRQYFTKKKYDYIAIIAACFLVIVFSGLSIAVLMFAFFLSVTMAFTPKWSYRFLIACLATILFATVGETTVSLYFFLLLPTLVHVFVFTFLFVLLGALRSNSTYGYFTLLAMIVAGFSFFIAPYSATEITAYGADNISHMQNLYVTFANLIGADADNVMTQRVFGFIGFAYTYHYLNWFSKTKVIGWNNISANRRAVIIALYIASISLYFYDYTLGFQALLILSFMHVVLEFPLNGVSVAQIVQQCSKRLKRS